MTHLIDGKKWALLSREETKQACAILTQEGRQPGLTVVLVGEDPASQTYVRGKEKAATEAGMQSAIIRLEATITQDELLAVIYRLNQDPHVHGILVQLPLPKHIDDQVIIDAIAIEKDVDGFHATNVGALALGLTGFVPCTPLGIMRMLAYENISLSGQHAVVIGRSNIVGKPMAQLLLKANATVTICHSKTENLGQITRQADILISAVGKAHLVKADMVKEGAVVIDVGMNRLDGKLVGDVDFENVKEVASAITPVPGGVGPMTIAMLLHNTVQAASNVTS